MRLRGWFSLLIVHGIALGLSLWISAKAEREEKFRPLVFEPNRFLLCVAVLLTNELMGGARWCSGWAALGNVTESARARSYFFS